MIKKGALYHYEESWSELIRADQKREDKLFQASMQSDIDLLKEMKVIRGGAGCGAELTECVDGADGEEEIV